MQCFQNGIVPQNRDERNALMDKFDEETIKHFDELDCVAWKHDISKKCYKYLQIHKNVFLSF